MNKYGMINFIESLQPDIMKTKHLYYSVLVIFLTLVSCKPFKPTLASSNSFKKAYSSIDWRNATKDKNSINTTCSDELLKLANANIPKSAVLPKNLHRELYKVLVAFESDVDKVVKKYKLESKLAEDNGLVKVSAKAKIFNAWGKGQTEKSYLKRIKTRQDGKPVNWGKDEKKATEDLLKIYKDMWFRTIVTSRNSFNYNHCKVYVGQHLDIEQISFVNVKLKPSAVVILVCKCSEGSTKKNLNEGRVEYTSLVEADMPNVGLNFNNLQFKYIGKPTYQVTKADCCTEKANDDGN